jgi:unsaturated rhamnogalacturonyl hydrolase
MLPFIIAAALASTIDADLRAIAALPGEPSLVSAGGITRRDTAMSTLENPSPFDAMTTVRRLVLIGGFDGDEASARAVMEAVRWIKSNAPAAVRRSWIVSAMPLANPDANTAPLEFPPGKGFFDDPQVPESRYLWRWLSYQAPDHVVVFSARGSSVPAASLTQALSADQAAGLGPVSVSETGTSLAAFRTWLLAATRSTTAPAATPGSPARQPRWGGAATLRHAQGRVNVSSRGRVSLHEAIAKRVAREPLAIARQLAQRYPESPAISYIPSVAWVNTLRLAALTGDDTLRTKVREQTRPWVSGEKALFGDRIQLTAVAGTMIFADLAAAGDTSAQPLAARGAELARAKKADGALEYGGGWTDDMFMASSIVSRVSPGGAAALLIEYASRLQRPDGLFNHAVNGPAAWGRGNGFAAFGLVEALTTIAPQDPQRPKLLEIFQRHMTAVRAHQAPDGAWRQVIDEPGAYREETATAMLLAAMARGIRFGWIDGSFRSTVERAWRALAAHIAEDGTLVDVCTSTGAGPTRRYYVDRAALTGADDRGGAMALRAAVEMMELHR